MENAARCVFTFCAAGAMVAFSGCTSQRLAEPETSQLSRVQSTAFQRDVSARKSESVKQTLRALSSSMPSPTLAGIVDSRLPTPLARPRTNTATLSAVRRVAGPTPEALLALRVSPPKPTASVSAPSRQPTDLAAVEQMYARGLQLERVAQAQEAVPLYRVASARGNSNASVRLMELYVSGAPGVPRDYARAIYYKFQALEQGAELPRSPRY